MNEILVKPTISKLYGQCMRKKRLTEEIANKIVKRAKKEGMKLYSYVCPHCQGYHLTRKPQT